MKKESNLIKYGLPIISAGVILALLFLALPYLFQAAGFLWAVVQELWFRLLWAFKEGSTNATDLYL